MQYLDGGSLSQKLYRAETVRELEPKAAAAAGVSMYELMERAGRAVFDVASNQFSNISHWLVLAGSGNNGGDAYVVARLAIESGLKVTMCQIGSTPETGDAHSAFMAFEQAGGTLTEWKDVDFSVCGLCIDGLFGTGLNREVSGHYLEAIKALDELAIATISIDVPSGIHANTGKVLGAAISADATVSFVGIKPGLTTGVGKQHTGKLIYDDLGIGDFFCDMASSVASLSHLSWMPPLPKRKLAAHKGNFGRVLCIGGGVGMPGAVRLSAEAALRAGAGLVRVFCHASSTLAVSCARPELMVASEDLDEALDWASVVVIGPGLGKSEWARKIVSHVMAYLKSHDKPVVIDADGLNQLASPSSSMFWPRNAVITPHPGEAARLLNKSVAEIEEDRFRSAAALQQSWNSVVLLKGPGTLVADAGSIHVCIHGNPGMATAGMGDVLSGMVAAMIAQGLPLLDATVYGACIHGASADICAENNGERGMIASDLFSTVRTIINS